MTVFETAPRLFSRMTARFCIAWTIHFMDTSHFDNDIAAALSDATAKRDEALGEIGEALVDQIRRMSSQAVEAPQFVVFHGLGETGRSRASRRG